MRGGRASLLLFLLAPLAGCVGAVDDAGVDAAALAGGDLPLVPVDDGWYDRPGAPNTHAQETDPQPFHSIDDLSARIAWWEETYPHLVAVEVIGESIEGRPIWDVVITDEAVTDAKLTPLIDGGHHANELGGIEIAMYTVDVLLANHATNATVQQMLRDLEVHVVPLVNPDGYVTQTRGNALGVNLNRNYDIDWGNPGGASNLLMGTLAHGAQTPMPSVPVVAENCGPGPFSEPESQAMRDLMHRLAPTAAFYMTGHTPTHAVIGPWAAFDPPFEMPAEHHAVIEQELQWVRDNTEYEAGKAGWGNLSAGLPYSASGSSMDYFYLLAQKPAFTVEVEFWYTAATSKDWPVRAIGEYEGLRYWMDATIPIPMHLLANARQLFAWQAPERPSPVPASWAPEPPDRSHLFLPAVLY